MSESRQGIVLQSVGGFYFIDAADAVYTCRARGIFRKLGVTPVAGDRVRLTILEDGKEGALEEVLPRKNCLVRPPVANLELLVVVASIVEPPPSTLILDKMIAIAESKGIEPVMVISKADLEDAEGLAAVYRGAGFDTFIVSSSRGEGIEPLRRCLSGKVSAFTGNSGVGKSSLLNAIDPRLGLATGEISRKLGRGRHTTRTATLFRLEEGGYIVDTPGFSSLDLERADWVSKEELPDCFREFAPYLGRCRFASCIHDREPGCAVRQAVEDGAIAPSRYESYVTMYRQVKDRKEWENK